MALFRVLQFLQRRVLPSKRWGVLNSNYWCPPSTALEASGSLFPPAHVVGRESSLSSSPTWLRPLVPSPLFWFCSEAKFCSSVYRRSVDKIMTVSSVGQARLNGGEGGEKNKGCACGGGGAGGSTDFSPDLCFLPTQFTREQQACHPQGAEEMRHWKGKV